MIVTKHFMAEEVSVTQSSPYKGPQRVITSKLSFIKTFQVEKQLPGDPARLSIVICL